MTENKTQLSNWIEDIVAFHKAKVREPKGYGIRGCRPVPNMRIQGL
ncbi:MAG: hypothetical protein ABJB85_04560 [Nitrososphaerota archaeon]